MKLFIYSQTTTVQLVISSHISPGMWLTIHAGIELNHLKQSVLYLDQKYWRQMFLLLMHEATPGIPVELGFLWFDFIGIECDNISMKW